VPAKDGVRLDHVQVLPPASRPESAQPDPEDSIASPKARIRVAAQSDLELMAEDEALKDDVAVRSQGNGSGAQDKEEQFEHASA
jgi:hypothetical protein